jgi:hypothetical protein
MDVGFRPATRILLTHCRDGIDRDGTPDRRRGGSVRTAISRDRCVKTHAPKVLAMARTRQIAVQELREGMARRGSTRRSSTTSRWGSIIPLLVVRQRCLIVEGVLQHQDGVIAVRAERIEGLRAAASVDAHDVISMAMEISLLSPLALSKKLERPYR